MTGIATAAISGAFISTAIADDFETNSNTVYRYDSQAEETRALNIQALESARDQNGYSGSPSDDADDPAGGQGGGLYDGPPGPDDMGDDDDGDENEDMPSDQDEVPSTGGNY